MLAWLQHSSCRKPTALDLLLDSAADMPPGQVTAVPGQTPWLRQSAPVSMVEAHQLVWLQHRWEACSA